jgi:hypothetical protein
MAMRSMAASEIEKVKPASRGWFKPVARPVGAGKSATDDRYSFVDVVDVVVVLMMLLLFCCCCC